MCVCVYVCVCECIYVLCVVSVSLSLVLALSLIQGWSFVRSSSVLRFFFFSSVRKRSIHYTVQMINVMCI